MSRSITWARGCVLVHLTPLVVGCGLPTLEVPGVTERLAGEECEATSRQLRDDIEAIRARYQACEVDEDCGLTGASVSCAYTHYFFYCDVAVRADSIDDFNREAMELEDEQCGELRACQISPSCGEMRAACVNGRCEAEPATEE